MQNNDSNKTLLMQTVLPQIPEQFFEEIINFKELMMIYHSAIRKVTTKLEILNDELSLNGNKSPILFITSRVKKPLSIVNKLKKLDKDITVESIKSSLNDVAGVRIVSSFIDDVYRIADMLAKQDDVKLITIKDYIANPKPNGYRSYHMIIEVPIFFSDEKQYAKVEIQIRTVAMDFWASLEHQLKYKKDFEDAASIEKELKECADTIANTDSQMMNIRNKIKNMEDQTK